MFKMAEVGGEGAKGIIKISGVVIYIMDGKRYQGPTTGPSHDYGDQRDSISHCREV